MPWNKRWEGAAGDGDYSNKDNWAPISIRNSGYNWTASNSGSNEYYLRTAANGNPGIGSAVQSVQFNGVDATGPGTAGSLSAGQWAQDDNDTLGYETIYVRLADNDDPDNKALDFVTFRGKPAAGDHVRIPAGTPSITTGLKQAAVAIGDFIVEEGYEGDIGSDDGYLQIDPNRFEFGATGGTAYIDITTAAIAARVNNTGTPGATGERGLFLLGSGITTLDVTRGYVGVAVRHGETSTVATARVTYELASLWIGAGCSLTTFHQLNGNAIIRCAATTVLVYAGTLETQEIGAITTFTQKGGNVIANSTGTITTYNIYAGELDLQRSGSARTISTLNKYRGNWLIRRNKEAVTITTEAVQDTYTENASA